MTVAAGVVGGLDGVISGEYPGRLRAKRLRTIEVGVALSLTGVLGLVGVRSNGFEGEIETEERSMMEL